MRRSAHIQSTASGQPSGSDVDDSKRVHNRLAELNQNILLPITNTLKRDPSANISHLFDRTAKIYPKQRERRSAVTVGQPYQVKGAAKSDQKRLREDELELPSPKGELIIARPLADHVVRLLSLSNGHVGVASAMSLKYPARHNSPAATLLQAIENGTLIWHLCGKFVIQLDNSTVVKFAGSMGTDDAIAMEDIHSCAPDIPISKPLGVVSIGSYNYIFMSFIPGVSLDRLWPSLTVPLKQSVQAQLTSIMHQLRQIPLPADSALGSGEPRRCKDRRRFQRICPDEIHTEEELNGFLTTNPERGSACPAWLGMVKSCLRSDHKMVMTHGDLRPANIMVEQKTADSIEITGLVDWDTGGFYPEYWEFVKASSGIRAYSKTDWFEYLPLEAIGNYVEEFVLDILIDQIQL